MKKYTIILIIIGITLGFLTGLYLYRINTINKLQGQISKKIIEDETNLESSNEVIEDLIQVNNQEEKTSPNCVITLKVYYEVCDHLIETRKNIEEAEVNLTEEELKERFKDWEIQKFTPSEIVLYKEVNEFCNQHFVLKEKDGYIVIFKLDENKNIKFLKKTEISIEYLAEEDLNQIRNGIEVYTEKELNKTLEDFE